jgi:hypothetical protein
MRKSLESSLMPDGWQVGGDSRIMGQFHLVHGEHDLEMRFLKERRRTNRGGVPGQGRTAPDARGGPPYHWTSTSPSPRRSGPCLSLLWDFLNTQTPDRFTLRRHPEEHRGDDRSGLDLPTASLTLEEAAAYCSWPRTWSTAITSLRRPPDPLLPTAP